MKSGQIRTVVYMGKKRSCPFETASFMRILYGFRQIWCSHRAGIMPGYGAVTTPGETV